MKKNMMLVLLVVFNLTILQSCQEDKTEDTARVQLRLVDASGDYEEVNVEIIDIQYMSSENQDWTSFNPENGYPIEVDLTTLIAGNDLLLSDEIIPAGIINQIRLILSENNTILLKNTTETIDLDTPSAQQSGLKINVQGELTYVDTFIVVLDFDANESVHQLGNGTYQLHPVIHLDE